MLLAFLLQAVDKASKSPGTAESINHGWNVSLDIAAVLNALLWPLAVLVILLAYRDKIPGLAQSVASRITKVGFAGVSLELAKAAAFVPEWSGSPGTLDLRQKATAIQVNDSTAMTFSAQLMEGGTADYAEVNLGAGQEWLTSRLFIMSIVFARMKGIQSLVFVETAGTVRRQYAGWAQPGKIRWALARRYAWLEQAYSQAYSNLMITQHGFVVTNEGKLGTQFSAHDAAPSLELIREFLQLLQAPYPPPLAPPDTNNWILVDSATNTYEHASWITSEDLEAMLAGDLNRSIVRSSDLRAKGSREQLRMLLAAPERFEAVVSDDQRFEYLLDRNVLLEQVAKSVSSERDGEN